MGKKALGRRIVALEQQLEKSEAGRKIEANERESLHDALLEAGFLRVTGMRTQEDRLRAARLGIIVLDDVDLLADSEYSVMQDEISAPSLYGFRETMPGRVRHQVRLDFTGNPEILQLLAERVSQVGRISAGTHFRP